MEQPTIEELRKVIALSDLPDDHLQWILDHSEYREFEDGTVIIRTGEPTEVMWILLEGKISFYRDFNGTLVYYYNFENDNVTGGVGGLLPYSRMKTSAGYAYASGKVRGMIMHKKYFAGLEQLNPEFIQRLIGYMTERARYFATLQLQQEKVSALGKLSAGIAHELNNPASAINRISSELKKRLSQNFVLTDKLLNHCVNPQHIQSIHALVEAKEAEGRKKTRLTARQRIQNEDEINNWFEKNGFTGKELPSETFAEAGFTIEDFEKIRENVGEKALLNVLQWLENFLSSERVVQDLEEASGRISGLVTAIKSHVHMDRTNEMQATDLHKDIENTLTLLGYKLREKNISVTKDFIENFPEINAYAGELNQVWTNLIDNAIYAMDQNGKLTVKTCFDKKNAEVRIIDNGSGISSEIKSRIFDPFFTTKKVGDGTGIGLDIVTRIVKKHNGEIKVNSVPGKTEFIICIPITNTKATG
jgi:signal transduction histidine kinase